MFYNVKIFELHYQVMNLYFIKNQYLPYFVNVVKNEMTTVTLT